MKRNKRKIRIQFYSTVAVILLSMSQFVNYLESCNYNKILKEFNEKNEIFFNYQREQIERNYYEILAIERFLLYNNSGGMNGRIDGTSPITNELGIQVDRLNNFRENIRNYDSYLIYYSIGSGFLFVLSIIFLLISFGLYRKV